MVSGRRAQGKDIQARGASGWDQGGLPRGGEARAEEYKLLKLVAESSYLF